DRIIRHLGKEYCPDRIVFLPVIPRLASDGTIDTQWCMKAYATSRMNKTSTHPVFRELSRLKEMMLIQQKLSISTT
ncbi:MAG: hypothetical protein MI802_04660, partial [Desulfobacterales bacterium]|nr:hypothetical protein [Desulfobacterales bacterium]